MIQKIKTFLSSPDYPAWMISVGMVLFIIHNRAQPLINYIFLPQVGISMILFGLLLAWHDVRDAKAKITFGSKWIWIPMLVIVASCWARVPLYGFNNIDIAGALTFTVFFSVYLASRYYGEKIFKAFTPALIIEATTVIVFGLLYPGLYSGGIITSPPDPIKWANYELANGFMLFAFLIYTGKYKWELGTLTLVAIFFTGAPEAVFLVPLLVILMIIRKDWNWRKLIVSFCIVGIIACSWQLAGGYTLTLWDRTHQSFQTLNAPSETKLTDRPWGISNPIMARIYAYQYAWDNLSILGHGISITNNTWYTVHNVPFVIVDQIGFAAAIAWCIATGYLILKSKHKYLWIMFVAMGAIDHYTWDNAAVWWWAIAGTSIVSNIKSDRIFENDKATTQDEYLHLRLQRREDNQSDAQSVT